MSEEKFIDVTTKFCHPYMNFGGDGCDEIVLKIPLQEFRKFQEVEISKSDEQNQNIEMSDTAQVWGIAFSSVLFFYFSSIGIGNILRFLKNSL